MVSRFPEKVAAFAAVAAIGAVVVDGLLYRRGNFNGSWDQLLCDALMDSIPVVCLTGQVPTHLIGNDAFQEVDCIGITRPCVKHNFLVERVEEQIRARTALTGLHAARAGRLRQRLR